MMLTITFLNFPLVKENAFLYFETNVTIAYGPFGKFWKKLHFCKKLPFCGNGTFLKQKLPFPGNKLLFTCKCSGSLLLRGLRDQKH